MCRSKRMDIYKPRKEAPGGRASILTLDLFPLQTGRKHRPLLLKPGALLWSPQQLPEPPPQSLLHKLGRHANPFIKPVSPEAAKMSRLFLRVIFPNQTLKKKVSLVIKTLKRHQKKSMARKAIFPLFANGQSPEEQDGWFLGEHDHFLINE